MAGQMIRKDMRVFRRAVQTVHGVAVLVILCLAGGKDARAAQPRCEARIDYVVPAPIQPHEPKAGVIWYDDFDSDRIASYLEPQAGSADARFSSREALGGRGQSMECFYPYGGQGRGNRKLVFGDSPIGRPLRKGERFPLVYWRFYVKHETGWAGTPDKLCRATGMVSGRWNQAFISHVWSSGLPLTLDPATGVKGDEVITTGYNDFPHLRWLGNSPKGKFPLHDTAESGRWVCVESMLRVNTPGQRDGRAALWVDGKPDAERKDLDLRGAYTGTGSTINAIFLEAYWNAGSPRDQYRYYDDFVVSTNPIGPITAPANPTLVRTGAEAAEWQVEVGSNPEEAVILWSSKPVAGGQLRVSVNGENGGFVQGTNQNGELPSGKVCFCRLRTKSGAGEWSAWSDWHQPFSVR